MDKPFTFSKALLRWIVVVAVAWLFMRFTPGRWFVNWYLPMSFFLLMGTVTFGVVGLGWPFAAPGGSWKPGKDRWVTGIAMCIVWIAVALILTAIETWVWPRMPLSGAPTEDGVAGNFGTIFGIGVFMLTLWYAFDGIECRPFGPNRSWANWLLGTVIILVGAGLLWAFCTNLDNTTGADASFNAHGKWLGGTEWFPLCIWIIVFIQMFGSSMVFQGWPFYKAGKVLYPLLTTFFAVLLGFVFWKWVMPGLFPDSTSFTWGAIAASLIGWSLMHSVAFGLAPFGRLKQPLRGVASFLLAQVVVPALWIMLIRWVLGPALLTHINSAMGGPAADINLITAWFTLHVTAIVLLVHNGFFMRAPFSIPGPPLAPEETQVAAGQ